MKGKIVGDRYYIDSREVTREEFYESFRPVQDSLGAGESFCGWKRPVVSSALAVHPDQVAEATADAVKKGVPVEFRPDGRPVFTSTRQRAAYCRAYGFFDRNAGYSDAQRGSAREQPAPKTREQLQREYV